MISSFQLGPIRPPSEAYSLLIRATCNCSWNRCKFCPIYKGDKFQLRPVPDIKQDIITAENIQDKIKELAWKSGYGNSLRDVVRMVLGNQLDAAAHNVALWMYADSKNCFLQDANTIIMRTNELVEVIRFLKETLPTIDRITSYGRSKTAAKKTIDELVELRDAGLSRLHIGLESGYDPLLKFMDKGVTAADHISGGQKVVESGISLSEYVLLGLGGKEMWQEHAIETARVLNEINPDFIRVRTLAIREEMPLYHDIVNGSFARLTDEEIIEEEKLLIEHLNCQSNFVSDHILNLLQEIEGKLPENKEAMLACIDRFQNLPTEERAHFIVGRRLRVYNRLDELSDVNKRRTVEPAVKRLYQGDGKIDNEKIYGLMEGFI
jgi:histone acetyltransferase (RNA polymerase elongator complex component)